MDSMPPRRLLLLAASALLVAPLLAIQLATDGGRVHACSCTAPPPPTEALEGADAVFTGRVVAIGGEFSLTHFSSVKIEVDTVWKGSARSTTFVYVWFGPSCGYEWFEVGKEFLVYAHHNVFPVEDPDTLFVHLCSRTRSLEYAEGDLEELGAGRTPEPGITAAMSASSNERWPPRPATAAPAQTSGDEETPASGRADAGPAATDAGPAATPGVAHAASEEGAQSTKVRASRAEPASGIPARLAWWAPLLAGIAAAVLIIRRWARRRERR